MKTPSFIATGAAIAAMLVTANLASAGSNRYHGTSHRSSYGGCRAPVVIRSAPRYCPPPVVYTRPVIAPVYYRPAVVSAGWGVPSTACQTTVYRGYSNYDRGYVQTRETVCRPVYPAYVPPPCGSYGYAPPSTYRPSFFGITFGF